MLGLTLKNKVKNICRAKWRWVPWVDEQKGLSNKDPEPTKEAEEDHRHAEQTIYL